VFGGIWMVLAASGVDGSTRAGILGVAIVVPAVLVLLATRSTRATIEAPRQLPDAWRARLGRINAAQAGSIGVVAVTCGLLGVPSLIPVLVCAVVALHFVALVPVFADKVYYWAAIGLGAASAVGALVVGYSAAFSRITVGIGAAACLWACAFVLLRRRASSAEPATTPN